MENQQDNPDACTQRFIEIWQEAALLAEAYRLRLVGRLWWANLAFVVFPSACAAAAAIFAAGGAGMNESLAKALAAGLAGIAAIFSAVHKSLKCEDYQNECLRLGAAYDAIATRARSAELLCPTSDHSKLDELKDLTKTVATLKENAKAPLPDKYITKARGFIANKDRNKSCIYNLLKIRFLSRRKKITL